VCARVTGRSSGGEEKSCPPRRVVRHGATIIKGKCKGLVGNVAWRSKFFSFRHVRLAMCTIAMCRMVPDGAGCCVTMYGGYGYGYGYVCCIYYVSGAGPMRVYAIGDGRTSVCNRSLRTRAALLHPQLVSCVSLHCAES